MSNDNTIKMTPAEMVDYNRGVNAFLEGALIGCSPDAAPAFELGGSGRRRHGPNTR